MPPPQLDYSWRDLQIRANAAMQEARVLRAMTKAVAAEFHQTRNMGLKPYHPRWYESMEMRKQA